MAGVRTYAAATGRSSWPPWEYGGTNKRATVGVRRNKQRSHRGSTAEQTKSPNHQF